MIKHLNFANIYSHNNLDVGGVNPISTSKFSDFVSGHKFSHKVSIKLYSLHHFCARTAAYDMFL